ncbi:hypothetical protein BO94DRAFT_473141, partial [Aspergillus sclerotioniger CBS 115572]
HGCSCGASCQCPAGQCQCPVRLRPSPGLLLAQLTLRLYDTEINDLSKEQELA